MRHEEDVAAFNGFSLNSLEEAQEEEDVSVLDVQEEEEVEQKQRK